MIGVGIGVGLPAAAVRAAPLYGPELVTNGDFANWTADNPDGFSVFVSDGEDATTQVTEVANGARIMSDGTYLQMTTLDAFLTAGSSFRVEVDIDSYTGPNALRVDDGGSDNSESMSEVGNFVFTFTPLGPDSTLRLARNAPGTAIDVVVSRVSVREIL